MDAARARKYSNDLLAFTFPTELERLGPPLVQRPVLPLPRRRRRGRGVPRRCPLLLIVAVVRPDDVAALDDAAAASPSSRRGARCSPSARASRSPGSRPIPLPWAPGRPAPGRRRRASGAVLSFSARWPSAVMAALWLARRRRRGGRAALGAAPGWRSPACSRTCPATTGADARACRRSSRPTLHERYLRSRRRRRSCCPSGIGGNSMLWHARGRPRLPAWRAAMSASTSPPRYQRGPALPHARVLRRPRRTVEQCRGASCASTRSTLSCSTRTPHRPWPGILAAPRAAPVSARRRASRRTARPPHAAGRAPPPQRAPYRPRRWPSRPVPGQKAAAEAHHHEHGEGDDRLR